MKRADVERGARLLYAEMGVEAHGAHGDLVRGVEDFRLEMRLPIRSAAFVIRGSDAMRMEPSAFVDRFCAQRDQLFRDTLAYMAQYDLSIRNLVDLDKRITDERTKLALIIRGMGTEP